MQTPFSVELDIASGTYSTRTVIIGSIKDQKSTATHKHTDTHQCASEQTAHVALLLIVWMSSQLSKQTSKNFKCF